MSEIPEDVRLAAGQVVVMLPPFRDADETGGVIDRIARAILAERERCANVSMRFVRYGGSMEHGITVNPMVSASDIAKAIRAPDKTPRP